MLSASHNAMPDNGIKFFAAVGTSSTTPSRTPSRQRLREPWDRPTGRRRRPGPRRPRRGRACTYDASARVAASPARRPARRRRLRERCCLGRGAGGAAPGGRRGRGGAAPSRTGWNINDGCGSTHLSVVAGGGASSTGPTPASPTTATPTAAWRSTRPATVVDGDQILAVLALAHARRGASRAQHRGRRRSWRISGFRYAMARAAHRRSIETAVGDRYVLEAMRAGGYTLGGEQSGHVIMLEHATTGDGMLTALHLLARMVATSAVTGRRWPAVMHAAAAGAGQRAGRRQGRGWTTPSCSGRGAVGRGASWPGTGRVLLRPSGTEALVRVMVEADHRGRRRGCAVADGLAAVVRDRLAAPRSRA